MLIFVTCNFSKLLRSGAVVEVKKNWPHARAISIKRFVCERKRFLSETLFLRLVLTIPYLASLRVFSCFVFLKRQCLRKLSAFHR